MLNARFSDPSVRENVAKNHTLSDLEHLLQRHGKRLVDFSGMPEVDRSILFLGGHRLHAEETMYNASKQNCMAVEMERTLNCSQRDAHNFGGTGKTYLYNALLC